MTYPDPSQFQQPGTPGAPYLPGFPGVPEGPLDNLQNEVAGVLNAADPRHPYFVGPGGTLVQYPGDRRPSVAADMVKGAAVGFGGWLVWRAMKARKARTGTWTTPLAKATVIWWVLFAVTVAAQAALQSWAVLIGGFAVSTVAACWYLRRKSVPRRARHRSF